MGRGKHQVYRDQQTASENSQQLPPQDVTSFAPSGGKNVRATPLSFLGDVSLELAVEFGRTSLSIGELLRLKRGSVISFEQDKDSPLTIRVNGNHVASGEVVVVNDHYGVRVTSITDPAFCEDEELP